MMRGGFGPWRAGRRAPRAAVRRAGSTRLAPAVEAPHRQGIPSPPANTRTGRKKIPFPGIAREPAPRARSRKPLILLAQRCWRGMAVLSVRHPRLARRLHDRQGVTIIKAASGPTKVQPEGEPARESAQTSTVLKRIPRPAVRGDFARDEPPMDVAAADKTPRIIPLAGDTAPKPPAPPPPIQTTSPQPSAAPQVFPEPKKVKTVAVRADGTIISPMRSRPPRFADAGRLRRTQFHAEERYARRSDACAADHADHLASA